MKEDMMSNKQIKRYELENINDKVGYASYAKVDLPKGSKVIDVTCEFNIIYIHAIVNTAHKMKSRWFAIFEQDMPMEDYDRRTFEYVGRVGVVPELYVFEAHDQ